MRHLVLLISALFFVFSSCKKKDLKFIVKGNVSALNIGGNIANVEIKVFTYSLGSNFETLNTQATTDASGNYEIEIERDKFEKVSIQLKKANYFTTKKIYSFDDFSTAEDNILNFKLSPMSWTKFNIESSGNTIKIQKIKGKNDCEDCCPNGVIYTGPADITLTCPNDGGSFIEFHYWINDDEFHKHDSIYNTPFDTLNYNIFY